MSNKCPGGYEKEEVIVKSNKNKESFAKNALATEKLTKDQINELLDSLNRCALCGCISSGDDDCFDDSAKVLKNLENGNLD